ncbi:MAG: hypothetical protein E7035_08720 [Verrucomicrobiaceae bacterium]|nr:hypothetical protein [Verrucomicrobiaceae bacterium]
MRKTILTLFCALLSTSIYAAIDQVTVIKNLEDGKQITTVEKLTKVGPNTYRLHIPMSDMTTSRRGYNKIQSIDIKRDEAMAVKGDEGYWVLADGRLGKFDKDNGTLIERRHPMPLYGVKKGNEAFVGIIKGLKYEFSMVVDVKNGSYDIFPRFHIRAMFSNNAKTFMLPYEDLIIDFTHFKGKKANYSSMGKEYRKYQLDRGEVRPLKQRVIDNPRLKYTAEAIFLKFQMAPFNYDEKRGPHWNTEDDPQPKVIRSYDNMMSVMKKLKELGIDKADFILTNWNERANGHNPMCSLAEPALGGNAKLKQLTKLAADLGYQVMPHILHTENYTTSPYFNKDHIRVDANGQLAFNHGMLGNGYRPCFKQVYRYHILDNYERMQKLGFNGPIHIDVTSAIVPEPCFSPDHYATRKDIAEYMNRVGLLSRLFFGGFTSEGSMDQVANSLDYVLYVSGYPSYLGGKHPLMTRNVPIWQLAYHGIILSNPFASTIDYNCITRGENEWGPKNSFTPKTRRLKMHEFGGRLTYYWHLNYDQNFPYVKQAYDEYQKVKHLQYEFMEYHDEIAPDVFVTRYSDGSRIVTNYSDKPFNYKGKGVVPALEYKLFNPEKK